jgi:acetyl esterase/lipase
LRVFRPRAVDGAIPCLYWVQGGGYVLPAREFDDQLCERVARDHQCVVISVRYRLAPEFPFPAAHNDCFAGLNWAFENPESLRIDVGRVAIAGASAGGGAAAAVALHIRDEGRFALRHQLLIYPMLDDRNETPSSHAVTDAELWCREANMLAWKAYLADAGGVSRYAAPAREANLKGLAPTTILTADLDLFFDENLIYASRLVAAGVPLELHVFPGVGHGFDVLNPDGDTSRRFFVNFDEALQRAFAIV